MQESRTGKNDFWDHVFFQSMKVIFSPKEKTFLKKVFGGWLIRVMFIKGPRHTCSDVIFCPDSDSIWNEDGISVEWEHIKTESNPNFKTHLHRLKTPQGWIVREFLTTKRVDSSEGSTGISLTYIPDPGHQWTIDQKERV